MTGGQRDEASSGDESMLAWTAAHGATAAERDRALEQLQPLIERLARQVAARGFPAWFRPELTGNALSWVWGRLKSFDPRQGRFPAWCRTILRNAAIDELRRIRPDALAHVTQSLEDAPERAEPDEPALLRLERLEPFGPADLARVGRWEPADRVMLLSLSGLWPKVPGDTWRQWLAECGVGAPFPPAGFVETDSKSERYRVLCDALGLTRQALAQRVRRKKSLLEELDEVKWLRGGGT
jgi:RNA polymerase sigma factor (sigma-70 family)